MSLLELDEYAADLERQGHGKRLLQLQDIKEELRYPYLDLRRPMEPPDEREMFTIITGETDHTLYVGLKTGCTVTKIYDEMNSGGRRKQRAYVRTDSGLRGSIR
jgi:transcription elongation factor SPT6